MKIGIVGLPNVGKSTLFNALTNHSVPAENYPFCTIDPSVGVVGVPDERLYRLAEISESKRVIPAAIEFVDIAGLVKGASEGEGLGNKFLSNIRKVDAILHVVRLFDDTEITHVEGEVNPLQDIGVINLELIMADLQTVSRRLKSIEKEIKSRDKKALFEKGLLGRIYKVLDAGKMASQIAFSKEETPVLRGLHLLSVKPVIYLLNKKAGGKNLDELNDTRFGELSSYFKESGSSYVFADAGVESELRNLNEEEKNQFRMELMGSGEYNEEGLKDLIRKCYQVLGLITFFTTGEKESRAWTIKEGSTAPVAGYAIHSDFYDKFIRAEVINWEELLYAGSKARARGEGKLRTEGKGYIVQDGDVIEFKI